jgi:hypothetical protein
VEWRALVYLALGVVLLAASVLVGVSKGWLWGAGAALTTVNVLVVLYVFDGSDPLDGEPGARQWVPYRRPRSR